MGTAMDAEATARPDPAADLAAAVAEYRAAGARTWPDSTPVADLRLVVLDCESSGIDPRRHRLVSIGAVAVRGGGIDLGDGLELLLRVHHNTDATIVHGITRSETRAGLAEPEALAALLRYLGDAVIVGHHLRLDLALIDAALARHDAPPLANRWLDTADLTQLLITDDAFGAAGPPADPSLDALCARFGVLPHDRHTAAGDAFLTALVLLRLLRLAARHGRDRLGPLCERPPRPPPE